MINSYKMMPWRSPMPLRFSAQAQANPELSKYCLDFSTLSSMKNSSILMTQMRRKTLNINTSKSIPIHTLSPTAENRKIRDLLQKTRGNQPFLEVMADGLSPKKCKGKNRGEFNGKGKNKRNMYVIRKIEDLGKSDTKPQITKESCEKWTVVGKYVSDVDMKGNWSRKTTERREKSDRDSQKNQSEKTQSQPKHISKTLETPEKLNLKQLIPSLKTRRISQLYKRASGLFTSTSFKNFYNPTPSALLTLGPESKYKFKDLKSSHFNTQPFPNPSSPLRMDKETQRERVNGREGDIRNIKQENTYISKIRIRIGRAKTEEVEGPDVQGLCGWDGGLEENYELG